MLTVDNSSGPLRVVRVAGTLAAEGRPWPVDVAHQAQARTHAALRTADARVSSAAGRGASETTLSAAAGREQAAYTAAHAADVRLRDAQAPVFIGPDAARRAAWAQQQRQAQDTVDDTGQWAAQARRLQQAVAKDTALPASTRRALQAPLKAEIATLGRWHDAAARQGRALGTEAAWEASAERAAAAAARSNAERHAAKSAALRSLRSGLGEMATGVGALFVGSVGDLAFGLGIPVQCAGAVAMGAGSLRAVRAMGDYRSGHLSNGLVVTGLQAAGASERTAMHVSDDFQTGVMLGTAGTLGAGVGATEAAAAVGSLDAAGSAGLLTRAGLTASARGGASLVSVGLLGDQGASAAVSASSRDHLWIVGTTPLAARLMMRLPGMDRGKAEAVELALPLTAGLTRAGLALLGSSRDVPVTLAADAQDRPTGLPSPGDAAITVLRPSDLDEVQQFDDVVNVDGRGISREQLRAVFDHGFVLGIRGPDDALVAHAMAVLEPMPADEPLLRDLAPHQAYFDGYGTLQSLRGRGLGDQLLRESTRVAAAAGKTEMLATVLPENGTSVRVLLKNGYSVVGCDPAYYPGTSGYRWILRQPLVDTDGEVPATAAPYTNADDLADALANGSAGSAIGIPIESGTAADDRARGLVAQALAAGWKGVALRRPAEWATPDESRNLVIMTPGP